MIAYRELVTLLNATDRLEQIDSIAALLDDGMIVAVTERDCIIGIRTTNKGDAALRARTLPAASA